MYPVNSQYIIKVVVIDFGVSDIPGDNRIYYNKYINM